MPNWNEKHLQELKRKGLIRDFTSVKVERPVSKVRIPTAGCKEVQWLRWNLQFWCAERGLELEEEYRFHMERKWRADFCIKEMMLLIEYEGLNSEKSGHTTLVGFTKDTDKYNQAAALGYRVIRVTVLNYKQVFREIEKFL